MPPVDANIWNESLLKNPHSVADKRRRVQTMFAAIAPSYDLNNHLHSLWMDQRWRSRAVGLSEVKAGDVVLDVACGTGDLTMKFAGKLADLKNSPPSRGQVIGLDFTFEMLPIARAKSCASIKGGKDEPAAPIVWLNGDAQALPLPDACVDVVSIAFGIRNVADPSAAIAEFFRVLRPRGRLVILEFSLPTNAILRWLYNLYFRHVLPRTATWISGDKSGAYKYLPQSVNTFIDRTKMADLINRAGFGAVVQQAMTFGVCFAYRGVKPAVGDGNAEGSKAPCHE